MRPVVLTAFLITISRICFAIGSIIGPATANVSETLTYTFDDGTIYPFGYWTCTNCSVSNPTQSGSENTANITFTALGTATIVFRDSGGVQRATKSVTVSLPVPNTTFTTQQNCGSTVISRVTNPPSGINWYWQTSASGTSTTNSLSTYTVSTAQVYYLRARWGSTGAWSSTSQATSSVSIITTGPVPPSTGTTNHKISNSSNSVTLTVNNVSGATSYKWYTVATGGTPVATTTTPSYSVTVPSGTTQNYYAESFNICPSSSRKINTVAVYPEPTISVSNNGVLTFNNGVTLTVTNPTFDSYSWLDENNNSIAGATSSSLVVYQPGTYKLSVTKSLAPAFVTSGNPVTTPNYIAVSDMFVPVTSESLAGLLPIGSRSKTTQFFDGLGRLQQTVSMQASFLGKDMVVPAAYDDFGRESTKYLPYVSTETNGWVKAGFVKKDQIGYAASPQALFYQTANKVAYDAAPYSEAVFEPSPLNRVLKDYGPGESWRPITGQDKFVKYDYLVNKHSTASSLTQEKIIAWMVNGSGMPVRKTDVTSYIINGFYADGKLTIKVSTDEQGNVVREYSNTSGQVVLKKVQAAAVVTSLNSVSEWALTYYVYDELGNLSFVFPPELSKLAHNTDTFVPSSTDLTNWAFQYKYDTRKRMTEKQVPGAGPVYMVYDVRDRVVLTQDANQRGGSPTTSIVRYWSFTKYDEHNRPILTGIKDTTTTAITQAQMQGKVDQFYAKAWARYYESYVGNATGNVHGYTNKSYPVVTSGGTLSAYSYLTVTYYDNYNFKTLWKGDYSYLNESLQETFNGVTYQQPATENIRVTGQVTGSKIKVLDLGVAGGYTFLKSVSYYDDKYRAIQTLGDNYKGGQDRTSNLYDFAGKILKTKNTQSENDILWKDQVNARVVGSKLVKSAGVNATWDAGAVSVQQLPAGQNGSIEFTLTELSTNKMVGLASSNPNAVYTGINYAFYINGSVLKIYEAGVLKYTMSGNLVIGDILRIERIGTTVKYYRNPAPTAPVALYTSATASSTLLFVDCSIYTYNATESLSGSIPQITTSFSKTKKIIDRRFDYDHAGRLVNVYHQIQTQDGTNPVQTWPEVRIIQNAYNELGQLIDKGLHSTSGSVSRQSVDYRYNIRGWLTSMNNASLTSDGTTNDDAGDYFGMNLSYNTTDSDLGNAPLYNGNIAALKWSNYPGNGLTKQKGYTYKYDAMNRLTGSFYKEKNTLWTEPDNNGFDERGFGYDLNGNIMKLTRFDKRASGLMDSLAYNYGSGTTLSNKLLKVTDHGDDFKGFIDGTNAADDYTYDANGNMLTDQNKGITTNIRYNYLNLPEFITKGGNTIQYIYDASGRKIHQVTNYSGQQKLTDYAGEFQYENDVLQFIQHEEGRIVMTSPDLIYSNHGESTADFVLTSANPSTVTINGGEKYLVATAATSVARAGISTVGGTFGVTAGERYRVRIKGYRDKGTAASSAPAHFAIKGNGADLNWPGAAVPVSLTTAWTESWTEQIITIPTGVTQLTIGVQWRTAPLVGEKLYINEVEIIKESNQDPEYQYNLKDHLGNVRLTFTSKDETITDVATMETVNNNTEQSKFLYYNEAIKVNYNIYDHTYDGTTGATYYATRLTGATTNAIYGLAKSVSVMPGDVIHTEVFAKYVDTNTANWTTAFNTFMASIAGGTAPAGTVVDGGAAGSLGGGSYPITTINHSSEGGTAPKAYLNFIVFNKDMTSVLDQGFIRITTNSREYGQNCAHDLLQKDLTITEPGYVYIYLSNENPTAVEVFFDDFKVQLVKSPVVQVDDYYAFGLTFNSYQRENTVQNKYKFGGKEQQTDLELNTVDWGWRQYDAAIGRWSVIDQWSEKYNTTSPYAFVQNNPILNREIDGRYFDEKNARKAAKIEKKAWNKAEKLESKAKKLEAKGKDSGDLRTRASELKSSTNDIVDMANDKDTEYRYSRFGSKDAKRLGVTANATTLDPIRNGKNHHVIHMFTESGMGKKLHETRHGGQVARQEYNPDTNHRYGVADEVSAYRAEYSWSGTLSYRDDPPADVMLQRAQEQGLDKVNQVTLNNINQINSNVVNSMVEPDKDGIMHPLYPPTGSNIPMVIWNSN